MWNEPTWKPSNSINALELETGIFQFRKALVPLFCRCTQRSNSVSRPAQHCLKAGYGRKTVAQAGVVPIPQRLFSLQSTALRRGRCSLTMVLRDSPYLLKLSHRYNNSNSGRPSSKR